MGEDTSKSIQAPSFPPSTLLKKSGLKILNVGAIVIHSRFPDTHALIKSKLKGDTCKETVFSGHQVGLKGDQVFIWPGSPRGTNTYCTNKNLCTTAGQRTGITLRKVPVDQC